MSKRIDPAVAWLSSLVAPLSPKEFLFQQAAKLLSEGGQAKPPFNPKKATPSSVKRIEIARLSRDGMLIPVEGGFVLKLNSQRPLVRQNFVCAHEIGHTFFYDLSGLRPWRPYESMSSYWAEEDLCYQFAEEMLMPQSEIAKTAGTLSPSMSSFQQLLRTFQVSAEALARRIARLGLWHCILLVLVGRGEKTAALKRKVVYKPKPYQYYSVNWDLLLSHDSAVYPPLADPGVLKRSNVTSVELFRHSKMKGYWSIESFRLPGTTSEVIVVILLPE